MVYADIELINGADMTLAQRHIIGEEEIKRMTVTMLVDTGAYLMAINETVQEYLQLPFKEKRKLRLADDTVAEFDVVGPVEVRFKNRSAVCNALLLPGNSEPLLGAIPIEEMDVLIHPYRQELIINPKHPDGAVLRL